MDKVATWVTGIRDRSHTDLGHWLARFLVSLCKIGDLITANCDLRHCQAFKLQ